MDILQCLNKFLSPSLVLASILFVIILKKFSTKASRNGKLRLPPSPPKLPIIGNLHQLGHMPHQSLRYLASIYGPVIHLQLGEVPTVVISSARVAKEALKTHDLVLASRPEIFSAKHLFYNCTDIVFAPYGSYWRSMRKICILELFSMKRVQSYSYVREEEAARLVRRIAGCYPGNTDLSKFLGLYANDVLCRVVLGRDFSGGDNERHNFDKMLEEYQVLLGGFSIGDFFPSFEFLHTLTGMKQRLKQTFASFDKFFDEVIDEHLNPKTRKEGRKDLVDVLLEIQMNRSTEKPLSMDNIKAIMLDMFAAGTDTTFITLDWGMTELMTNPKVMERAQSEVRSIMGARKFVLETDLIHMPYLKALTKEIFRLHPPAPVLVPRESMEDITIDEYHIPAKTRYFINVWAIGRDPESWENAETFEPERFMNNDISYKGLDYELLPFGGGRRSCPAINFGASTVELALAQLLHSFDWELPPGIKAEHLDMTEVFGISMHKKAHLNIVAKPRYA